MKKTVEEQIRHRLLKMSKKGAVYRGLALGGMFFCIAFFHFIYYIRDNKKRLAMVMMSMVLFAAYASFSLPIFPDQEEMNENSQLTSLISDDSVSLVQDEEISMEELINWEDDENLIDHEEANLLQEMEEDEQLNLEDILNYRMEKGDDEEAEFTQDKTKETEATVFSRDDWRLILVNKQHPIPEDYRFTLATIKGNMQCDERIINDLLNMMQAAKEDGVSLLICSPYRSDARQEYLFNRKISRYMSRGMSYMDAYKLAGQAVTVPGSSEHQIGLSLDIVCNSYQSLDEGFGDTEAGIWLREHCAEFGFILRYPKGKEYITGIEFEPWHFRYVGVDAATIIMSREITLEEFVEELE